MTNNSSTGGFLSPSGSPFPAPMNDAQLATFFTTFFSGLTGIDPDFVRPRWQPTPQTQPTIQDDWMAVGIQSTSTEGVNAVVVHAQTKTPGISADIVQRTEILEVLCSIYGPNAGDNASLLRDGLAIRQNREPLQKVGLSWRSTGEILNISPIQNQQYYRRLDVSVYMVRCITRVYPVCDLLSSSGTVLSETAAPAQWATANVKEI